MIWTFIDLTGRVLRRRTQAGWECEYSTRHVSKERTHDRQRHAPRRQGCHRYTGSGQGLGLAYAQELARRGASVVINDVNEATAAEAVKTITYAGGNAVAVVTFGGLDIVVNNAGILRDKSVLKMTAEDFDLVIKVHRRGTFLVGREAFRYFKENGVAGRIIPIGSPTGQYGNFGQSRSAISMSICSIAAG